MIYAENVGGQVIEPTWRCLKFGTYLRRESDKRTYGNLFRHRTPLTIIKSTLLRSIRPRISEEKFLERYPATRDNILVNVKGTRNHFADICVHGEYVRDELRKIARHPIESSMSPFIGIHIRQGDFAVPSAHGYKRNSRIPVEWFVNELERIRNAIGGLPTKIFTDDNTGIVASHFDEVEHVEVVKATNALVDILHLSLAQHIICSNSTFSLWAVYLSRCTASCKHRELFTDYGLVDDSTMLRLI